MDFNVARRLRINLSDRRELGSAAFFGGKERDGADRRSLFESEPVSPSPNRGAFNSQTFSIAKD
jgi:hypothetical protein